MTGLLKVPFFEDEALLSFASRMARANGRIGLRKFLKDLGLDVSAIIRGDQIDRLAAKFEMPFELLEKRAVKVIDHRQVEFDGQRYNVYSFMRDKVRVCARCLEEDDQNPKRMPGTRRYGRAIWSIKPVCVCRAHHMPFTELDVKYHNRYDFSNTMDISAELIRDALETAEDCPPTGFEEFVYDRFAGVRRHGELLDGMETANAIDLCEVIGRADRDEMKFTLPVVREVDRAALAAGFSILRDGERKIWELLDRLSTHRKNASRRRGGRALYGRFYFAFKQSNRISGYEDFKEIVSRHAFQKFALLPETQIFGSAGSSRSTSLNRLHEETGLQPKTIRLLIGEFGAHGDHRLDSETYIDAELASKIVEAFRDTIRLSQAATLLGWRIHECRRLIALGFLKSVVEKKSEGRHYGAKPRYSRPHVLELKAELLSRCGPSTSDMISVRQANAFFVSGHEDIIKAVFEGRLKRISYTEESTLIDAVRIDPTELFEIESNLVLGSMRTCEALELEIKTFDRMVNSGILPLAGKAKRLVRATEIGRFDRDYISLTRLCRDRGIDREKVEDVLSTLTIQPAFPVTQIGEVLFKRSDIPGLLAQVGRKQANAA